MTPRARAVLIKNKDRNNPRSRQGAVHKFCEKVISRLTDVDPESMLTNASKSDLNTVKCAAWQRGRTRPDICHFSPQLYFWAQFFSTWKLRKFCIDCDVFYITHMPYVEIFRFLHNFHVETSEISPHVGKFSISPQLSYMESWNFSTWQFFLHEYNSWYSWKIRALIRGQGNTM